MVTEAILGQVSGGYFAAMTGSKDFMDVRDGLHVSLARNKMNANRLNTIYDTGLDFYSMRFYHRTSSKKTFKYETKDAETHEDIYCNILEGMFTIVTGLYTRFWEADGRNYLLSFGEHDDGQRKQQRNRCPNLQQHPQKQVSIIGEIRQNEEIVLHSGDGTSVRMVFKNLAGRNFQSQEYAGHTRHIVTGKMRSSPGIIEHCRDDGVIGKDKIPNI